MPVCVCTLCLLQLLATLWTAAHQPPCPWDSPDKNTEVGCHALLQRMKAQGKATNEDQHS